MSSEWDMPRRADTCLGCQRVFEIGETFRAFLYETDEGYQRRDYCCDCRPPEQPAPIGSWKTRRPEPAVRRVLAFDREAIYGFFERLEEAREPHRLRFRFVLALLLWRKKVLKLERTVLADGDEVWEFVAMRTGTPHRLVRPDLDEEQLGRLSDELEGLLAAEPGERDSVATDLSKEDDDG